ncbi:hypothetical protein WICPIJ_008580 [Wickerhamomyces pijperi]|uniref:Rab-GAP TBC domain-containing protein n=1 Tax=Wickerhamomyces pijperi TaxID=599730 RepID=A0A9P8THZ8_WICPI|nr:hypothetical protein WICPIJ_008580 [Wickerhamomyces pijperi]
MTQVYQNEFVFGEGGGKGTNSTQLASAPSLLKTLSHAFREKDKVKKSVVANDDIKTIGTTFSHLSMSNNESSTSLNLSSSPKRINNSSSSLARPKVSKRNSFKFDSPSLTPRHSDQYTDLDDDWDADVEHGLTTTDSAPKNLEFRPQTFEYPTLKSKRISGSVDSFAKVKSNTPLDDYYEVNKTKELEAAKEKEEMIAVVSKINRYKKILNEQTIELPKLKKMAWNGIPEELRPLSWQLLIGYLPPNSNRRDLQLQRKRQEYLNGINQVFASAKEQTTWHQIEIDIPRTNPKIKLYTYETTQRSLERILYLWALRHPASGYVQGINDLCTPFFQVYLSDYIKDGTAVENFNPGELTKQEMNNVEADTYWSLTKLLEGIQDNYIHAQPGIIRQVNELKDLIKRIDFDLSQHLETENVEFIQFSFRWMNCMLMRELSVKNTIRMWDTYLAEPNGFSEFHIYVCAAFLVKWSDELKKMEFQDIMMFLQNPPTKGWTEKDVELLLSEAFIWQSLYKNAAAHLR